MTRRHAGAAVLVLWTAVLGWHVRREYFPPEADRLARAARLLPPGSAYYSIRYGDRSVGWAQVHVDTLPAGVGFRVESRLALGGRARPGAGAGGRGQETGVGTERPRDLVTAPGTATTAETRAVLSPLLELRSFGFRVRSSLATARGSGVVVGDSLLLGAVHRDGTWTGWRLAVEGPVVPPAGLPLRLASAGRLEPGRRVRIPVLDPVSLSRADAELRVEERDLRIFPDSARRSPDGGGWEVARRDTVLAWRIRQQVAGIPVSAWIDEEGRLVSATVGEGLEIQRTAFELAFYGAGGGSGPADPDPGPELEGTPPGERPEAGR